MKTKTTYLIAAIAADDPQEFEQQFNEKMSLLSDNDPEPTIDISNGFRAVIKYRVKEDVITSIKDEYHLEGIRHICAECPLHDLETDSRRKWVTCQYSDFGETHLDHECCDYFYKQMKIGNVRPGEPNRSGRKNSARCRV